jgi:pimeloyl-ACP methyl ester carboxylesterase
LALLAMVLVVPIGRGDLLGAESPSPPRKLPAAIELSGQELISSDGLQLKATYYPGTEGKDSVPVILLHMFKGDGKEYAELAPVLQERGCAVLVPDLRGHGESTSSPFGGAKLDAARMGPVHFSYMRYDDMETFRKFLVKENDQGELNLNKLCLVGAEMGAAVAAYYAFYDWTTPRREAGRAAPSQDVKGLVLISPDWSFKGMPLNKPLSNPLVCTQISAMILVGKEDSRAVSDARRAHGLLERCHVNAQEKDLFFLQLPTKLQGTKILGVPTLKLEGYIGVFIERRLADKSYEWYPRGKGD